MNSKHPLKMKLKFCYNSFFSKEKFCDFLISKNHEKKSMQLWAEAMIIFFFTPVEINIKLWSTISTNAMQTFHPVDLQGGRLSYLKFDQFFFSSDERFYIHKNGRNFSITDDSFCKQYKMDPMIFDSDKSFKICIFNS